MSKPILLSAAQLNDCLKAGDCIVVDCRFDLANTGAGCAAYLESHIPGAVYAHLDDDLSGPVTPESGRHPLPEPAAFAGLGIDFDNFSQTSRPIHTASSR